MSRFQEKSRPSIDYWASRARLLLVGVAMENVVFRREVNMDSFGRLKRGSPVYRAHGLMVACLVFQALILALAGWRPMVAASSALLGLLAVGTHPFAATRAWKSLEGDRRRGRLEEWSLTSLAPEEVFDGKFFGLLAPLIEVRRYLMVVGVGVCWGVWRLAPGPGFLLALALWLTGINQVGHSLHLGTLAGLKWGVAGEPSARQVARDWRLNPWSEHLWLHLKIGLVVGLPLIFLLWLGSSNSWTLYSAYGLMLVIPFYCAINLNARQQIEYEHVKTAFRTVSNLAERG